MPRNIYDIKHVMKTEDKKIDKVIFERILYTYNLYVKERGIFLLKNFL